MLKNSIKFSNYLSNHWTNISSINSFPAQNLQYSVTICTVLSCLTPNSWYWDEYRCYLVTGHFWKCFFFHPRLPNLKPTWNWFQVILDINVQIAIFRDLLIHVGTRDQPFETGFVVVDKLARLSPQIYSKSVHKICLLKMNSRRHDIQHNDTQRKWHSAQCF
jgi:hypothetical protein